MPADNKKPSAAEQTPAPILVRAVRLGMYGGARKRPGDEFAIQSVKELGSWMERLDGEPNPKKNPLAHA